MSFRLPRFRRASSVGTIQLTARDKEILRLIYRHRFLRSSHVTSLVNGSSQQILRRLKLLYHHGYLERPRLQLEYYYRGGSHEMVHGLTDKGSRLIAEEMGSSLSDVSWSERNRAVERMFLKHALFVSDVMVSIEIACRKSGVRFIPEDELSQPEKKGRQAFRWKVNVKGMKIGVFPDCVFAIEFTNQNGAIERSNFFLEADRGTMPVVRKNLWQTSFHRKLLGYEATWSQSIHRKRLGFDRFRVLTVTTCPARIKSITEACAKLKRGHGLFLFADKSILEKPENILNVWKTTDGDTVSLYQ